MHHPELEQQLEDIRENTRKTIESLRDLAIEARNNADRSGKTIMAITVDCRCSEDPCKCANLNGNGKKASSKFLKKLFNRKKA